MGVTTITQEFTTSAPPSKMFKALILDSHTGAEPGIILWGAKREHKRVVIFSAQNWSG
jgi:hypothetical protein